MKICRMLLMVVLPLAFSCQSQKLYKEKTAVKNPGSLTMQLNNGYWFDGQVFVKRDVWVDQGILSFKKPVASMDTVINLSGKYIIPPFAEAHNHNLESAYQLQQRINSYLDNGVFYVKLLSTIKKRMDPLMHHYNKPTGLDVSMAHAPLTGTGGHPIGIRKGYLEKGYFGGLFNNIKEIESHGYYTIDNIDDLQNKWDQVLSFSPDFIKLNLLYSEEYDKRKEDSTYFGRKGLNPELVDDIVKKAHDSKLRVSVHVSTAHDFHVAVEAGVDEIAHLPEIHNGEPISVADAKLAKKKDITLVTTASLVLKNEKRPNYAALVENISSNLQILKREGVRLAIGSDGYFDNSVGEFRFLHGLNIFSNLELLKMWCENAAFTTFPNRKIAFLKEGYEASFLVLNKNPLEDMSGINEGIILKVKQGNLLRP